MKIRIIVAGYLVRNPLGGSIWTHLQYPLGLQRFGHDVYFFEEFGWSGSCYDPSRDRCSNAPRFGLEMIAPLMQRFGLGERWVYRDAKRECWGLSARRGREIISKADVLLNLSGVSWYEGFERIPVRIFMDEDPGFTQFTAAKDPKELRFLTGHTHFFSYGSNIGQSACRIPALGLQWKICCQPVVLREWPMSFESRAERFTTVMKWASYDSVRYRGETYGQKNVEFAKIERLPSLTRQSLEVAVGSGAPRKKLKTHGWHIADPLKISRDVDTYRDYLQRSRGELSIAKNGYVKTGSGWFSDRSATYLASGKPVILQDTGYFRVVARRARPSSFHKQGRSCRRDRQCQ